MGGRPVAVQRVAGSLGRKSLAPDLGAHDRARTRPDWVTPAWRRSTRSGIKGGVIKDRLNLEAMAREAMR